MKDVVIGRPAVDNYMVAMAVMNHVSVLDATETILAVHQTGTDGNKSGYKNKDARYNLDVIGNFDWNKGLIIVAKLRSIMHNNDKDITIIQIGMTIWN